MLKSFSSSGPVQGLFFLSAIVREANFLEQLEYASGCGLTRAHVQYTYIPSQLSIKLPRVQV